MTKIIKVFGSVFIILILCFFLGPRIPVTDKGITFQEFSVPISEIESYINQNEAKIPNLVTGTNKRIVWAKEKGKQTDYSLVYIHGYRATRQEIAPVPEEIAKEMGMNLFETRFEGSGISDRRKAFIGVTLSDHLQNAYEALSVAKVLGKKVVLISNSTGGPYSLWLANRFPDSISALVLFSPNIFPKDWRTHLVLGPWGKKIAYMITGGYIPDSLVTNQWGNKGIHDTHQTQEVDQKNAVHVDSLFAMMGIVGLVKKLDESQFKVPIIVFYSKEDRIVSSAAIKKFFDRYGTKTKVLKELVEVKGSTGTQHGMVGFRFGDHTIKPSVQIIVDYLKRCLDKRETSQDQTIIHKIMDFQV